MPPDQAKSFIALRIAFAYALIASAWILLSDTVLFLLKPDETTMSAFSLLKGLMFVGVTTSVVYFILYRGISIHRHLQSELREENQIIMAQRQALEKSEKQFKKVIEEAPIPILIFAEDGEVLEISNSWIEITGYTAQQLRTVEAWTELAYGEAKDPVKQGIDQLFDLDRRVDEGEFTIMCSTGQKRIWNFSSAPLGSLDDGRRTVMSVAYDVTERKQMELALRESQERFQQIAENIHEVFFLNDVDKSQTLYISPAYEAVWGESCESLYQNSRSFLNAIHPDDRKHVIASFDQQREGKQVEISYRIIRHDRDVRWIRSKAFPICDEEGKFTRVAGTAEDITDLVRYQQQLKRLSRRLVFILDEERSRIARELHDQIGQELTALGINLGVMETQCEADDAVMYVINESSELVSNMLARIRRIIADLKPLALDDMGLAAGLRWYCERFTRRTGIPVTLDNIATDLAISEYVDNTLYQIVQEALTNVVRHAHATNVWIEATESQDKLILIVRDNGVGFDVAATLDAQYGKSWGLLIMQERIQTLVGSRLYIDSELGQGTQITIEVQL